MTDEENMQEPRYGGAAAVPPMRPQSLMLTFLGNYVLDRGIRVSSGSFIDVFERVGVSEQATRSTLTRMVRRGLLHRQRSGRRMYFGLTTRSQEILKDGEARIWRAGAVNLDWDGWWTLLGFSLPETWQRQRHDLRSRLVWAGFGPLQNGLWIAPSKVDVTDLIGELETRVRVFYARPAHLTDIEQVIRDAYDLEELSCRYRDFLERWDRPHPLPHAPDDLARKLCLLTEWLQIIRRDPRLPVEHLPGGWLAARAQQTFRELHAAYERPAQIVADAILDTVPGDDSHGAG